MMLPKLTIKGVGWDKHKLGEHPFKIGGEKVSSLDAKKEEKLKNETIEEVED